MKTNHFVSNTFKIESIPIHIYNVQFTCSTVNRANIFRHTCKRRVIAYHSICTYIYTELKPLLSCIVTCIQAKMDF